jgi:hypothetical protein
VKKKRAKRKDDRRRSGTDRHRIVPYIDATLDASSIRGRSGLTPITV